MALEDMDLGPSQRTENGMVSPMVFQDEALKFPRAGGDPSDSTGPSMQKAITASAPRFMIGNDKMFPSADRDGRIFGSHGTTLQHSVYGSPDRTRREEHPGHQQWNAEGSNGTPSGDGSGEDDEEDDEDVDDGDGEVDGLVPMDNGRMKNHNNSSGSVQSSSEKICQEKVHSHEHHSLFGSSRGGLVKDGNDNNGGSMSERQFQDCRTGQYESAVTIAEPEMCYSRFLHGEDIFPLAQKETGGENGCRFSGRKDTSSYIDYRESLRTHLSDPITGALMDDAMILSCGHSFGSAGVQHVIRAKACFTCGHPISEDLARPNLALRSAVHAFRREEETQSSKASKRRRDRFELDKCKYDDSSPVDISRCKGVQFPFVVSDRVIIKGNKRTPQRFVGRVAVVTTQCLNGWYVVKTLDNAESVKLQYRSLAKVTDDPSSNMVSNKDASPNWL